MGFETNKRKEMMKHISMKSILAAVSIGVLLTTSVTAKETNAIPYPLEEWKGVQGKTLKDSKPYFVGPKKATKDAPNVLVIMLDDAGYSNAGS